MKDITYSELTSVYKEVSSIISKCEKIQVKFSVGSSQHTLLRNRIKAMTISKLLVENEFAKMHENNISNKSEFELKYIHDIYTNIEIVDALNPIKSINSKCENAQKKHDVNTKNFNRYINLILSMNFCKTLIEYQLNNR